MTAPALDELQKLAWPTAAPMTGPHGSGGRAGRDPCWRAHVVLGVQRPSEDRVPSLRWTRLAVGFRWSCGDEAGAADDEDLQLVSVQRLLRHELIASGALGLAPRPLEDEYECFVTIAHVRPGTLSPPSGGAPRTWEDGAAIFLTLAAVRAEPDEQGTACLEIPVERQMPLAFEWPELQARTLLAATAAAAAAATTSAATAAAAVFIFALAVPRHGHDIRLEPVELRLEHRELGFDVLPVGERGLEPAREVAVLGVDLSFEVLPLLLGDSDVALKV